MSDPRPVVVCNLASAHDTARQVAEATGARLDMRGSDFTDTAPHLRTLFSAGHTIIGIMSSGILIRALGPVLGDKRTEPPVLSVAEDASAVVPLLGGHRGANALARKIAASLNTAAAVTTAGDVSLGVALDEPPLGWRLENPEAAKPVMAALLKGAEAELSGDAPWLAPLMETGRVTTRPGVENGPVILTVEGAEPLVFRHQNHALGVGCARGCPPDELIALVGKTLADNGLSRHEIASIHSIDLKADEAAIHALATHLDVPATFFPADQLEAETGRLKNPSDVVFAEVGCHGVAEGAALLAAGQGASLSFEKHKSANATCALAEITANATQGQLRGRLAVVGIGPGQPEWRTPEATRLIAEADELVGYSLYIDLLGPAAKGKIRHDFPLGDEEARCRHALEAAGQGRNVALICSGDAGIYAMGALVMELLHREEQNGGVSVPARRVEIIHAPGISALQAASARAGALLGHDFCAISLSDLLTPREDIQKRIRAAAEGDFVIAFYNPVSKRRRTLLAEAREELLRHRPADTPVLLASSLGRPEEKLVLRHLRDLDVDEVDMLTIVLVGASTSKTVQTGDISAGASGTMIYTPRGYARKMDGVLP